MFDNRRDIKVWLSREFPELQNIQPLPEGGQKFVFSAVHPDDGDIVLKIMKPGADIERAEREHKAVETIQSDRIPKIFSRGKVKTPTDELYWFREQLIHGRTVRECVDNGLFDKVHLLRLALHVSETLVASETVEIVHRDIKPDNLILDDSLNFWLIDFGLARHLALDSLTATANAYGNVTWGYAPLEQCRNFKQDIDIRADLFALGVTLYECATGSNPFREGAANAFEILKLVEQGHFPRLNLAFPSASDFGDLISALTQKHRVHRPQSAKEAHDWIMEICVKENVT